MTPLKRDIISINDLSNPEIEEIFALADDYCDTMAGIETPHKIRKRRKDADAFLLATLFYEPSTRTRFSFESAMLRLGGNILGSTDPATTSSSKGESLADTVRVIENYVDLIVLRHPCEGAARAAAECVEIPVINGGDGSHEHPTQTLCDLYTLRRENKTIKGLNVLLVGDLKNGRTVHSLVYALARFGANIITMPGESLELPNDVSRRLEDEFKCRPVPRESIKTILERKTHPVPIGAVYVAPSGGEQYTLLKEDNFDWSKTERKMSSKIDVCYVTRLQGERLSGDGKQLGRYPVVNEKFLRGKQYSDARVLHPLPRVSELGYELDRDPRGVYFKQAGYGVPVRMALIAKILGIVPFASEANAVKRKSETLPSIERICPNPKCITHSPAEQRYVSHRAEVVRTRKPSTLRCVYCDTTVPVAFIGYRDSHTYVPEANLDKLPNLNNIMLFASEEEARSARFKPLNPSAGRKRHPA
jgi:aspartate carbamoyltransferase catalytic subunit